MMAKKLEGVCDLPILEFVEDEQPLEDRSVYPHHQKLHVHVLGDLR